MNIGICTQPLATNYGAILQNYALQTVLRRMGHNVWTFDIGRYTWFDYFKENIHILVYKLLGKRVFFRGTPIQWTKLCTPLRRFVYNNISLTIPQFKCFNPLFIEKYNLNCLICGSDQIWRPRYVAHIEDFYLRFAQDYKLRRIAYAASFGTDEWEYTNYQQSICAALAHKFDAISVREQSGIYLCREYLGVVAEWVLDPTMLLEKEDYLALCADIPSRSPFIFAYVLDDNEELMNEIKKLSAERNLPYVIKRADSNIDKTDSIELWLSLFRDADFVMTDSFHGTVFSVLFHKDFAILNNIDRGSARFDSLLSFLGLEQRIMGRNIDLYHININWNDVENKLIEKRAKCLEWLKQALNN